VRVAVLSGTHRYQLDSKGRISLPQRFREAFLEGAWMTLGQDGCLAVYPGDAWERWSGGIDDSPNALGNDRAFARIAFGLAEPVELDGQGRVTIPQRLRTQVGIGKDVVVIGVRSRLEVWDGPTWDEYFGRHAPNFSAGDLAPGGRSRE
jgi:MraZ protein